MISEICPLCSGTEWRQPEGNKFWVCNKCKPEEISIEYPKQPSPAQDPPFENLPACPACKSKNFWLPKNSQAWRCEICSPPPSQVFVSERHGQSSAPASQRSTHKSTDGVASSKTVPPSDDVAIVAERSRVTYCTPWCGSCSGWHGIETVWSDWRVELACATCGRELPERPRLRDVQTARPMAFPAAIAFPKPKLTTESA